MCARAACPTSAVSAVGKIKVPRTAAASDPVACNRTEPVGPSVGVTGWVTPAGKFLGRVARHVRPTKLFLRPPPLGRAGTDGCGGALGQGPCWQSSSARRLPARLRGRLCFWQWRCCLWRGSCPTSAAASVGKLGVWALLKRDAREPPFPGRRCGNWPRFRGWSPGGPIRRPEAHTASTWGLLRLRKHTAGISNPTSAPMWAAPTLAAASVGTKAGATAVGRWCHCCWRPLGLACPSLWE
jgi:hypothetical protein